jgi:predicted RNA-binding Zn-ribbon protein involved in translation (DUF1610 family)
MWGSFRPKAKCKSCGDVIESISETTWKECSCGDTKIMGKSYYRISGNNWEDVSDIDTTKIPEHKGF